jgi:glutamate-1-semialdehyde 2,1-aminomutase
METLDPIGWTLLDEARELIPCGTGTNSKAAAMRGDEPAYIVRGKGCRVWDLAGKEYIDYRNALGPITLGHAHPAVNEAIARQLADGIVFSYPHPLEVEVARRLTKAIPAAEQVRYLKTGGEAMAAVIKLARAFTGRSLILTSGYHGWLQTVHHQPGIPAGVGENVLMYNYGDLETLESLLKQHAGQVAAVTLSGSYPDMTPDDPFPQALRRLTREHGTLLVIDEIVTGFRLAIGGWHEYYNLKPDLAVFSKGMANGMPLSVYLGRRDIMQLAQRGAIISSTFSGETLSLAAACAVLDIYQNEPVIERLWQAGSRLRDGMQRIFHRHGLPITLPGLPPCPRFTFAPADPRHAPRLRAALFAAMAHRGVLLYDVPYVNYSHTDQDIDETLGRLDDACRSIDLNHLPEPPAPAAGPLIGAAAPR